MFTNTQTVHANQLIMIVAYTTMSLNYFRRSSYIQQNPIMLYQVQARSPEANSEVLNY